MMFSYERLWWLNKASCFISETRPIPVTASEAPDTAGFCFEKKPAPVSREL
jgi:hypothetical protein